jgi:hypothetical protein
MWVPYLLLEPWKPESPADQVRTSLADGEERDFLVGFYLKNPVTNAWEVDLQLFEPHNEELAQSGEAPAEIGFYASEAGKLNEIVCRVRDVAPRAAVERCYRQASRLLSLWAVTLGRGLGVVGFRVADLKHGVKWRSVPFRPSALSFRMPDFEEVTAEQAAMAWLYREARNAQSPAYRLLCSYAILEAWSNRLGAFARTADQAIAEQKLDLARPMRSVTQEMAILSGVVERHPEFNGAAFEQLLSLLKPWRDRVAGALFEPGTAIDLDDYDFYVDLTSIANLADFAARQVLLDELELWARINRRDESSEPPTDAESDGDGDERFETEASATPNLEAETERRRAREM